MNSYRTSAYHSLPSMKGVKMLLCPYNITVQMYQQMLLFKNWTLLALKSTCSGESIWDLNWVRNKLPQKITLQAKGCDNYFLSHIYLLLIRRRNGYNWTRAEGWFWRDWRVEGLCKYLLWSVVASSDFNMPLSLRSKICKYLLRSL